MKQSNYVKMFKALSNDQRLKIFLMIYERCGETNQPTDSKKINVKNDPCCPGVKGLEKAFTKACECMNISRSTISHHFKELQNAGLIHLERDGQSFNCSVDREAVQAIRDFLK